MIDSSVDISDYMPSRSLIKKYQEQSKAVRQNIVKMVAFAKAAHIGSALSAVDILTVLYFGVLRIKPRNPGWAGRDRLIFSKGHAATALYAVLVQRGFAPQRCLDNYYSDGSKLAGHPVIDCMPGVEVSTGSLGHGLPIGLGMALAAKHDKRPYRVFVILSEGDCDEGSTWEAAMLSAQLRLDNLIAVVDYNKIQALGRSKNIMNLEPFKDKWQSFGWIVKEIDGHNYQDIFRAFKKIPFQQKKPSVVIAHTIKGKGISFMEDKLAWHYQYPDKKQLREALKELDK